MTFVKAGSTAVTVEKSQQTIIKILGRYGARDFGFDADPETEVATVRFRITHGNKNLPIELRVDVNNVYKALYDGKDPWYGNRNRKNEWRLQARQTAWRLLVDWLDAALSTTTMGIQTVEEVFLAHIVLTDRDGQKRRVVEHVAAALATQTGWLRLESGQ